MVTIIRPVAARNPEGLIVHFVPGDERPEWAEALITNPKVIAEFPEPTGTDPDTGTAGAQNEPADTVDRKAVQAEAKELGVNAGGKTEEIQARIDAAKSEQTPPGDGDGTRKDLEGKATALGIEFTADTTDAELEALIDTKE